MRNKFLVDTSVLIDIINDKQTTQVDLFKNAIKNGWSWAISVFTYREVLQGSCDEREFTLLKTYLDKQEILFLPDNSEIHAVGAKYYQLLRQHGITIRNTIDMLIAQTAIEYDLKLLHNDRDFYNIAKYVTNLQMFISL